MPQQWWTEIKAWALSPFGTEAGGLSPATVLGLIAIIFGAWWLGRLVEHALRRASARKGRSSGAAPLLYAWARIARYAAWITATMVGLGMIGIDLTSFALVAGAVGIGIGLGLQNLIGNFISGLTLLLEQSLKVGDFVDLQSGVRGHVQEIGMRYTRITTNDFVDIIVPNSELVNNRVINWTLDNRLRRLRIPFGVAYGSDKAKTREAVLAAARKLDCLYEDIGHPPDVWLVKMGDSSLEFQLIAWVGPEHVARPGRTEARFQWAIHDALIGAGIEIPFPQRDLHLRSPVLVQMQKSDELPKQANPDPD